MKKLLFGLLGLLVTISGWSAETNSGPISSVTVAGLVAQNGTPTPTTPIDIVSNNGVLKARHQSGLPLRYQQIEWLRSTKGLIITGFKTKDTQNIKTKWMRASSNAQYVYYSDASSSGTTNTTAYVPATSTSGGNWRFDGTTQTLTFSSNELYETVQNKNGVWVNNAQTAEYEGVSSFTSSNDLTLFGASSSSPIRLYSLQIEENGIKTLDIIPVQDVIDNTYGVYDLVNGNFYTDAEATFTAGNPVSDPFEIYTDGEVETIADSANHTATVATLLGIGDYRDTQNINTGAITRRVGVKVLDGTEDGWVRATTSIYNNGLFDDAIGYSADNPAIICSHFQGFPPSQAAATLPNLSAKLGASNQPRRIYFIYDAITTEQWKQYLAEQYAAGTPVIIIYPLAEPTTESVAGQTMTTAPVNNRTGGVTGMTITTLLSSGASVVTTIATNAIKIATTAYNSARFSPVVTDLNTTIATIREIVTNTINQTKAIADLQATKQTRPDENCPAGKKCLLVEDNDGTPHWYEIIESAD